MKLTPLLLLPQTIKALTQCQQTNKTPTIHQHADSPVAELRTATGFCTASLPTDIPLLISDEENERLRIALTAAHCVGDNRSVTTSLSIDNHEVAHALTNSNYHTNDQGQTALKTIQEDLAVLLIPYFDSPDFPCLSIAESADSEELQAQVYGFANASKTCNEYVDSIDANVYYNPEYHVYSFPCEPFGTTSGDSGGPWLTGSVQFAITFGDNIGVEINQSRIMDLIISHNNTEGIYSNGYPIQVRYPEEGDETDIPCGEIRNDTECDLDTEDDTSEELSFIAVIFLSMGAVIGLAAIILVPTFISIYKKHKEEGTVYPKSALPSEDQDPERGTQEREPASTLQPLRSLGPPTATGRQIWGAVKVTLTPGKKMSF